MLSDGVKKIRYTLCVCVCSVETLYNSSPIFAVINYRYVTEKFFYMVVHLFYFYDHVIFYTMFVYKKTVFFLILCRFFNLFSFNSNSFPLPLNLSIHQYHCFYSSWKNTSLMMFFLLIVKTSLEMFSGLVCRC